MSTTWLLHLVHALKLDKCLVVVCHICFPCYEVASTFKVLTWHVMLVSGEAIPVVGVVPFVTI